MTVRVPFKWDANKWYRMKLRVDNRPDGTALVRGKVWPTGQAEPAAWTIEKTDKIAHPRGQPGHLRRRHFRSLLRQHHRLPEQVSVGGSSSVRPGTEDREDPGFRPGTA